MVTGTGTGHPLTSPSPPPVMSMYTLLRNNPKPEMEDIDTYFQVIGESSFSSWVQL